MMSAQSGTIAPVVPCPHPKPVILTFVASYLPGYKAGGILRTIVNTVSLLSVEFDFLVVTLDRDLKDSKPYPAIIRNQWQPVGKAKVYYLSPSSCTVGHLSRLVAETRYDILYLNSFFDPVFTIKLLWARKMKMLPDKPIILAPRGELVSGPLRLKYYKKKTYIEIAKLLGLYQNLVWQASSKYEAEDFINIMGVDPHAIHVALDLPSKDDSYLPAELDRTTKDNEAVRLIFLSRLTREKNLDYALKVLGKVSATVIFDIYGPAEDPTYWKECQKLISELPANVTANYLGSVMPEQVVQIFGNYDLFFFPSTGENYGHVVAESLTAGTPVLTSTETPWRDLQVEGLGWDKDLAEMDSFAEIIDTFSSVEAHKRMEARLSIKSKIAKKLLDPAVLEANYLLFSKQL